MFGDSLAAGYGVDPARAYPALLEQRLGAPVVVEGEVGAQTRDSLERFAATVPRHEPFLVVVQLGGNDFTHRVSQDETFRNIEQLVARVQRIGAVAVVVSVDVDLVGDTYGAGYREIAKRQGAAVVTGFLNGILGHPEYQVDPIHPNERGHAVLADRLDRVLRPILDRMPAARSAPAA